MIINHTVNILDANYRNPNIYIYTPSAIPYSMGKMPAGLRRYWAKKRAAKRKRRAIRPKAARRRRFSMARRRYGRKRGGRGKRRIPIAATAGMLGALVVPAVQAYYSTENPTGKDKLTNYVYKVSGIDASGSLPFNVNNAVMTGSLIIGGCLVSKYANKIFGVSRYLPKPFGA